MRHSVCIQFIEIGMRKTIIHKINVLIVHRKKIRFKYKMLDYKFDLTIQNQ